MPRSTSTPIFYGVPELRVRDENQRPSAVLPERSAAIRSQLADSGGSAPGSPLRLGSAGMKRSQMVGIVILAVAIYVGLVIGLRLLLAADKTGNWIAAVVGATGVATAVLTG